VEVNNKAGPVEVRFIIIFSSKRVFMVKGKYRNVLGSRALRVIGIIVLVGVLIIFFFACNSPTKDLLTTEEREYIKTHGPIRYAPDPAFQPFEFLSQNNRAEGITPDILERISKSLLIKIETVPCKTWSDALDGIRKGEIDLLGTITRTEEREEFLRFTRPYLTIPYVIFVTKNNANPQNIKDFYNKRLGVVKNYGAHAWLKKQHPQIQPIIFETPLEGLKAVASGKVDGFLENLPVGAYLIEKFSLINVTILPEYVFETPQHFAVAKDNTILLGIIEKGLNEISLREYSRVFRYWSGYDLTPGALKLAAKIKLIVGGFILLTLVLIFLIILLQHRKLLAEKQLFDTESRLENLFNNNLVGICFSDGNGLIIKANKMFASLFGLTSENEVVGKDFFKLLSGTQPTEELLEKLKKERRIENVVVSTRDCKNEQKWIISNMIYSPKNGGKGEINAVVLDITEHHKVQEELKKLNFELEIRVSERTKQLEEAVKDLESFTWSVSHDLREPLRFLNSFSQMLQESIKNKIYDKTEYYLQKIIMATREMNELIDALLRLSRVSGAKLNFILCDITGMVKSVCKRLTEEKAITGIQWEIHDMPKISGDPILLKQVFENLISNAIKFSRGANPPKIEIGSLNVNGSNEIIFYVKDNGCGFNPDDASKLFDVFHRLHPSSEFEGTGIGLAIVKKIVSRHNGRVWAEGVPNGGATFYFSLPIQPRIIS